MKKGSKETKISLNNLWERGRALAEREAEKATCEFQALRNESTLKTDLIEAKLHLAYAQSYQLTSGNLKNAQDEYKNVIIYLDTALNDADKEPIGKLGSIVEKINTIKKEVKRIKIELKHKEKDATDMLYEQAKNDLRQLIKNL